MSSPIANRHPNPLQKTLVLLHQLSAHSRRISALASCIGNRISRLFPESSKKIRALDVGCGDMTIVEKIAEKNPAIEWICTDIHELPPHLKDTEKWRKYRPFDGLHLPFEDKTFDVVLFSDVLHHCLPRAPQLLREAARVGRFVVVKDHFERGMLSRQMLRLMDFVGNYGYGVLVPKKYFTPQSFRELCRSEGLRECHAQEAPDLYSDSFLWRHLLRKSWQFLAVLEKDGLPSTCGNGSPH